MNTRPVIYQAKHFASVTAHEAVALVAGFNGHASDLGRAAVSLAMSGRDVFVYAPEPDILLSGDPALLPAYATETARQFRAYAADYPARRYSGYSLGGGIAANMQKNDPEALPGLYAATGIDAARLVTSNVMFRAMVYALHKTDIRRRYAERGYGNEQLARTWQPFQEPPHSFTLALGALDYIVRPREIRQKLASWQPNHAMRIIQVTGCGHNGMKRWFNAHVLSMVDELPCSNQLQPRSDAFE